MEKKCLSEMEYRNRIQINKSHGFLRDSLPPEGPWWTAPTRPNPTPLPHPRTLPNLLPLSYLITEVLQFEYLDLFLDLKLTMHLATTEAIRCAAHGQSVTVSYSLRYDKKRSQLTPTQSLCLWKSTVLPHFLQNLRYIQSTTDVTKLQTSLNLSLVRALHVYGDHTTLLADTGVPPLILISTPTFPNTFFLQKHILIPFLLLCLRILTSHSPSTTFIPLPSTTTSGIHFTNSTLTPSLTISSHDHLATEVSRACLLQHTAHYY